MPQSCWQKIAGNKKRMNRLKVNKLIFSMSSFYFKLEFLWQSKKSVSSTENTVQLKKEVGTFE